MGSISIWLWKQKLMQMFLMIKRGGGYQIGFEIEVLKSKIAVHGSVGKKALFWLYINFEFAFISLLFIGFGDGLGG